MRTKSARQKYTAKAITVGTRRAHAAPRRFVTSPINQTERKRSEMPEADERR